MKYLSHRKKELQVHIQGVLNKSLRKSDSLISKLAILFHDLGKINPNFQKKLNGEDDLSGYSEHAYLSAFTFLCFISKNKDYFEKELNSNVFQIKQIIAIIAKHHSDLPDFDKILNEESIKRLGNFFQSKPNLPISDFVNDFIFPKYNKFDIVWNERLIRQFSFFWKTDYNAWQKNSLGNFIETQFVFSCLLEADKRDAGNMEEYYYESNISESVIRLDLNLKTIFKEFTDNQISELNRLRNEIRIEAIQNLKEKLTITDDRVFTLTAPTGSGKTLTLLALANQIQKEKGNLGIIYGLPFLSITEQVQNIIQNDLSLDILPISSKSVNERIEETQKKLDKEPTEDNLNKLLKEDFLQTTFDHPFVLTTFVQIFETLMSNKNSTLLKLSNFKNRIILIDEVQSLPPQLYIFFSAWLSAFCEKYQSYCILSTATMPCLEIPNNQYKEYAKLFFNTYKKPNDLLDSKKYYETLIFNRYQIQWLTDESISLDELADCIKLQLQSCLVIVNTIDDSKSLYSLLKHESNTYLLNTHFTPFDRTEKIKKVKNLLNQNQKVILVSTQLIEAGVDISFPIVYRDLCPMPSLIQSAGRCNRNNELLEKGEFGMVYLFNLVDRNGKSRSELVYRNESKEFLNFCKQNIKGILKENDLFELQSKYFHSIANNLTIGEHEIYNLKSNQYEKINLIHCANEAKFETIGKFRLIQKDNSSIEYQYYIPINENDDSPRILLKLLDEMLYIRYNGGNFENIRKVKIKLQTYQKFMFDRTVTLRVSKYNKNIEPPHYSDEIMGIRILYDINDYSDESGLNTSRGCIL